MSHGDVNIVKKAWVDILEENLILRNWIWREDGRFEDNDPEHGAKRTEEAVARPSQAPDLSPTENL